MLAEEHALQLFREFETRRSEFLRLDLRDKAKEDRKRISAERYEKAILKKSQGQVEAYRRQQEKIKIRAENELKEGTLKPQKTPL